MSIKLDKSVGQGGINKAIDVAIVQALLRNYFIESRKKAVKSARPKHKFHTLKINGSSSVVLVNAIKEFQKTVVGIKKPDGKVDPGRTTFNRLLKAQPKKTTKVRSLILGSNTKINTVVLSKLPKARFKKYFKQYFGLTTTNGEDLNGFVERLKKDTAIKDIRWAAYMLATVYIESGLSFKPVREYGKGKGKKYSKEYDVVDTAGIRGKKNKKYKNVYYGRGYVQLTWDYNYKDVGKAIGQGNKLYIDPDLALDKDIAYKVASYGMRHGSFTHGKHTLARYFNSTKTDYKLARYIINGTDKRDKIARIAKTIELLLRLAIIK